MELLESYNRVLRLFQESLRISALQRSLIRIPLNHSTTTFHGLLGTPLLELDHHLLPANGDFDLLDVAVEGGSAEEGDVDTRLTGEIVFVRAVVLDVWFEY